MLWAVLAVVVTVVIAMLRVVTTARFYFADDTQAGAFGQWWELGDTLLQGRIPVLDPQMWQGGNYFAEGQWGLLNPLTWLVALGARASDDAVVYSTIVKVVFLAIMSLGVYLLARGFGATAPWAAVAGVLAPTAGFTVYMDAASWVTGLFNAALFPWVWWALRRAVERGRSPIPYFVASYLLITFGYVFGVIVLVIVLVEMLVRTGIARQWDRFWRAFAASAWGGLLTIVVYLPAVLTAPVTARDDFEIVNRWFLSADLSDLASAAAPVAAGSIGSWWGPITQAPLVYIAWILPFLPLFAPVSRAVVRRSMPLYVLGIAMLAIVIGPSDFGPIRWPVRFMPYLALAVVLIVVVMASRTYPGSVTTRKTWWSAGIVVAVTGISWANTPYAYKIIFAIGAAQLAALLVLVLIARQRRVDWSATVRTTVAVAGVVLFTIGLSVVQTRFFPSTPLPKFGVPASVPQMSQVLSGSDGDAIAVGDLYYRGEREASFDERLLGNLWYLSDARVSSVYTVLPFSAYADDLCSDLRGATCRTALDTLWSIDETTGAPVADLMNVSTIVAMKRTFPVEPDLPAGWHLQESGEYTWVFARDEAIDGAGGVVWAGEGTEVSTVEQSGTSVTLRVDEVGADGRVALSRLPYPGYSVSGAALADPLRGWLLTVDVADAAPGDTVTITFRPPGFWLLVIAGALALAVGVGWVVMRARAHARQPGRTSDPLGLAASDG